MRTFLRYWCAGFGLGYGPKMPGTWGTLLGFPLAWLTHQDLGLTAILWSLGMGLSVWAIAHCVEVGEDPGWVVCDEFMAFWGCIAFLPLSQWWQACILFRLFDIFKPWPLPWLERSLPTAYAIMMDDFVAALYALGLVYGVNHWLL